MKCSHLGNSAIVTNPPLKQKQRTNCLLSDGDIADYNDEDDDKDEDDDDDGPGVASYLLWNWSEIWVSICCCPANAHY